MSIYIYMLCVCERERERFGAQVLNLFLIHVWGNGNWKEHQSVLMVIELTLL